MSWLYLLLQKELTAKVYNTKHSSTEWFISSVQYLEMKNLCTYVRARPEKSGKWSDARAQHSHKWMDRFSTGIETTPRINFKKGNKIERFLFEWRKRETLLRWEESLIRRLTSQYGWVFLLVELYFGSPKGSPKYCRLVKIPSHIASQPSNKIYICIWRVYFLFCSVNCTTINKCCFKIINNYGNVRTKKNYFSLPFNTVCEWYVHQELNYFNTRQN